MNNYQTSPLKLYIQDIYRAEHTENKYMYQLFGLTFKNIMIHGVITAMFNDNGTTGYLELSDPTGSVQIYYDTSKSNTKICSKTMKELSDGFNAKLGVGDANINIMRILKNGIVNKDVPINFCEGSHLSVIGDIFIDDSRNVRMVAAYECNETSVEREIVWLEELKYLYEKYYLSNT